MASVSTIFALVAHTVEEEFATEGTHDNLIELSSNELVSVHFMDFVLAFANGALTAKTSIQRTFAQILLDYIVGVSIHVRWKAEMHLPKLMCKARAPAGSTENQASMPSGPVAAPTGFTPSLKPIGASIPPFPLG